MTTADTDEPPQDVPGVHTAIADLRATTLLAVGAPLSGKDRFVEHLLSRASAEDRDTLHVAATRGQDRLAWALPADTRVVDCSPSSDTHGSRVASVGSPADLTGIGMSVSRFLDASSPRPVVTVDSVSTLLVYNDDAAVFRFLAVLTAQLRQTDGVGIFLLEDGCHDQKTVRTFQQLFDGRVDIEADRVRVHGPDDLASAWRSRR